MKSLEKLLGLVAALALLAMTLLTFADVIGRKLLGNSVPGSVEVTELLMLLVIFVALPLTTLHGEHVIFDLLDRFFPSSLRVLQHRIAHLICVLLVGGGAWLVLLRANRTVEQGDTTAQLQLSMAPYYYATAVLLMLTAIVHLWLAFRASPEFDEFHMPPGSGEGI